ncbi:MAG: hypothetical protein ACI9U2_001015 [Bradymonadia bacterium]
MRQGWLVSRVTRSRVTRSRVTRSRSGLPICALTLVMLLGCTTAPVQTPASEGVSYLVALGVVPRAEIERARWALEAATRRLVVVLPARALPATDPGNPTLDAGLLLDGLLRSPPPDAFRVAAVTTAPLRAPDLDAVIGYARIGERAIVYSTHLLPRYANEAQRRGRVRRIIDHELGHTYGATHCDNDCVMRDAEGSASIDDLPRHYCPEHRVLTQARVKEGPAHPRSLIRLGGERMRLGQWAAAISAYQRALKHAPNDYKARTAMGIAQMARGELTTAEETFITASRANPRAPQPYYARAVLYASGVAPRRASAFLEAAVHRDNKRTRAHRAAGILYQDVLANDRRALRHFHAHVQKGGRDAEVIARLVYLMQPATLTFNEPETIIARWNPVTGLEVAAVAPTTLMGLSVQANGPFDGLSLPGGLLDPSASAP